MGSCERADAESRDVRICAAIPSLHHQESQRESSAWFDNIVMTGGYVGMRPGSKGSPSLGLSHT
jgi:hypothetical protein